MRTRLFIFQILLVTGLLLLAFASCRKDKEEDTDTTSSRDNAFAEATYQDVANITEEAAKTGTLSNYRISGTEGLLSACATVTHDSINNSNPDTITVDFGTVNCTGSDGRNRRGKIIISYSGRYRDSLTTINITFDNYFVNDNQVLGTKTIVNNGHNAAGHLVYTITVNGEIRLASNGGTITWTANKVREWTSGENTLVWADDIYSITGSATGTGASGNQFSANITSPLIRNMAVGCRRHFVKGTVELTPANKPMRVIDYGNGTCDDVATVTINGNVYTVQLR